jgi:hypothetical protein
MNLPWNLRKALLLARSGRLDVGKEDSGLAAARLDTAFFSGLTGQTNLI